MKSVQMCSHGHAEALTLTNNPIPKPRSRDVLIKVRAVAINPFDLTLLEGQYKDRMPQKLPTIFGSDFAG